MIRAIRWLLVTAVGLAILMFAAVAVFLWTADFNAYRSNVETQVREATGRELQLRGELSVRAFSFSPSVTINDVVFANASWGSRPEMLRAERIEARIAFIPLIFGDIELEQLAIVGADLLLETDPDGRRNWVFETDGPGGDTGADRASTGRTSIPFLQNLRIDRSRITYRDGLTKLSSVATLDWIRMETSNRLTDIRLDVSGTYNGTKITGAGKMGAVDAILAGPDRYPINVRLTYGDSDMDLRLVADLSRPMPSLTGTANSKNLNLDTLSGGGEAPTAEGGRLFSDEDMPIGALRAVNADVDVTAERLILAGNEINDVAAEIDLRDGNFIFDIEKVKAAKGDFRAMLNLDLRQPVPLFRLDMEGSGLSLSEVTRNAWRETLADAPLGLSAKLAGAGRSMHAVAASLSGPVIVDVGEGRIESGLFDLLSTDVAGAVLPWTGGNRSPRLRCLVARFDFSNGRGDSRVLVADTNRMAALGGGTVDLRSERIDLLIRPFSRGVSISRITSLIPIRVSGPLRSPSAKPDPSAAIKETGRAIISLPGQAADFVGSLFGEESGSASGVSCANARAIAAGRAPAQGEQRKRRNGGRGIINRLNPFD